MKRAISRQEIVPHNWSLQVHRPNLIISLITQDSFLLYIILWWIHKNYLKNYFLLPTLKLSELHLFANNIASYYWFNQYMAFSLYHFHERELYCQGQLADYSSFWLIFAEPNLCLVPSTWSHHDALNLHLYPPFPSSFCFTPVCHWPPCTCFWNQWI